MILLVIPTILTLELKHVTFQNFSHDKQTKTLPGTKLHSDRRNISKVRNISHISTKPVFDNSHYIMIGLF